MEKLETVDTVREREREREPHFRERKGKSLNSGITLVALVVTVVVLLILAGVTIMYTLGDKSIINKAKEAKNKTEGAVQNEQDELGELANMLSEEYTDGKEPEKPETEEPTVPEVPVEEIKSDWEKIDKIAKEIASDASITNESAEAKVTVEGKSYTIKVGDIFEVEYSGEVKQVRVLGFKHDDLANTGVYGGSHTKAGISFEFVYFMTGIDYKSMNSTNTNEGGWANTQMRKDLNGYTTNATIQSGTIGGLGANLSNKSYIKQVKKTYIPTYNVASTSTCNDYLWLLSCSEIWTTGSKTGYYGDAISKEGNQYQYYKKINPNYNTAVDVLAKKTETSGVGFSWWLRSPAYTYDSLFCRVYTTGYSSSGMANNTFGVAPGFCI